MAHSDKVPVTPHYSTISRRINRLEIKINENVGNDIVIALDNHPLYFFRFKYPGFIANIRDVLFHSYKHVL
jgi:hypothetical protein